MFHGFGNIFSVFALGRGRSLAAAGTGILRLNPGQKILNTHHPRSLGADKKFDIVVVGNDHNIFFAHTFGNHPFDTLIRGLAGGKNHLQLPGGMPWRHPRLAVKHNGELVTPASLRTMNLN